MVKFKRSAIVLAASLGLAVFAAQAQVRTQADENALVRSTLSGNIRDIDALRRESIEMSSTLDVMRREIAALRGAIEVFANDIAQLRASSVNPAYLQATGTRTEQLAAQVASLDQRLKAFEPTKVSFEGLEILAAKDEQRDFDVAFAAIKGGSFARARDGFIRFLERYPQSGFAPPAQFWLASAHYGLSECRLALPTLDALIVSFPGYSRIADAMLLQGNCYGEEKDVPRQRAALERLVASFPVSEPARIAQERLRSLQ